MAIRPVIRLMHPPCADNETLAEALHQIEVTVHADMLMWTDEPRLGDHSSVFVRNNEIYHALAAKHGPQRARELTASLQPRQATAFPIECCNGADDLLRALRRLEPFDTP